MAQQNPMFRLTYGQKLTLLATIPLILAVAAIAVLVAKQSRDSAERELNTLEAHMLAAKKEELRNYVTQARNGFYFIYGSADPDDQGAKKQVAQILAAMIYGEDGSFFVYDYDGNNLVSPRRTELIGTNQADAADSEGTPITSELIRLARQGSGYHTYLWPKPSTGEEARMITFVLGFQHWRWAVGTGVFIDDVIASLAATRAEVQARTQQTYLYIAAITLAALLLVFASGLVLNIRERRLADAKLKELTQRVFDAQEEERGRVARELHDGISQMLVGIRFALASARGQITSGNPRALEMLDKGMNALGDSISEVRRISRDLRPGALDDLGLGPALKALTDDFSERTGIAVEFQSEVFRNRLDPEAKIALYRIAQEALTNIERHAKASQVSLSLLGHPNGATLRITDNGIGLRAVGGTGLGLRNMQERIEQLDGNLRIKPLSGKNTGTSVEALVPLTHLLAPAQEPDEPNR